MFLDVTLVKGSLPKKSYYDVKRLLLKMGLEAKRMIIVWTIVFFL